MAKKVNLAKFERQHAGSVLSEEIRNEWSQLVRKSGNPESLLGQYEAYNVLYGKEGERNSVILYAVGKNSHNAVAEKAKTLFPNTKIYSVTFV